MTTESLSGGTGHERAVRLLLADDHTMLREGLRRSMEAAGFEVVGEARDGDEAVTLASSLQPNVILMDISMPVLDGVEATRQVHRAHPEIAVVMLTMHADADLLTRALRAGAVGYLVKDASTDEVVEAVHLAARGETLLSLELAGSMLSEVQRLGVAVEPADTAASAGADGPITRREEEVLQLIAQGLSTPEVGAALFISVKTVKNHLASIYAKLDSRDRTQAVVRAVKMGIIHLQ
jgi:DNA-binding NarL/FixJ family response regulator